MNWKDVPGYEGFYQISDCGQVKSCSRIIEHPTVGLKTIKEKILKPGLGKCGYLQIGLSKNGKRKIFLVHRLVIFSHKYIDISLEVNHIDENRLNNHISNLEYLTAGDNTRAYHKNNPTTKVLDTHTNIMYTSLISASRYMYNSGQATGEWVYYHKIKKNKQDRFKIID